jgi:tetratricopeptide (TPR) repeat protein
MLHHRRRVLLLIPLICLPVSRLAAQHQGGNLHVYVTYTNDRAPTQQLKVELISGSSGVQVAQTYTDESGRAHFSNISTGTYQLSVTGQGIQATLSDTIDVDARKGTQSAFVRVKPAENGEANAPGSSNPVSTGDLRMPEEASKEFDKATKLLAKQEWQKAIDQLNKALVLYPAYAEAYNNLGVAYAHLGSSDKEREALQKAITANDHFAPALVNLARLEIKVHNMAAAEADLKQATSVDPTDGPSLTLLAQVQLLDHHYEDAIASAAKVHSMSHGSHPLAHYIAARAWERLNRLAEAVSELKVFLAEEPPGERATAARQEMLAIQKQLPAIAAVQ